METGDRESTAPVTAMGDIMFSKIGNMLVNHVKNNTNRYFLLLITFVIGICTGAFTVNGLNAVQREELNNYVQGFFQLLDKQYINSGELFSISLMENMKVVLALWVLGVMIIGIPFIFLIVGIRGFITGFSSGFLIKLLGLRGVLFSLAAMLPKEIILIPCIIALGVNGINFSQNIIKSKSSRNLSKESLKTNFLAYCFATAFYSIFILGAVLIEAYITPILIRMLVPVMLK